jgi:hypothetical protein
MDAALEALALCSVSRRQRRISVSNGWTPPPDDGIDVPERKCHQPLKPEGASTMQITTVCLDLGKNVLQVHGANERGKAMLRRDQLMPFFANLPDCLIGMEACGGAHHWARKLQQLGHTVKLTSPQKALGDVFDSEATTLLAGSQALPGIATAALTINLDARALSFTPMQLHKDRAELNLFTTTYTLSTPHAVTAHELKTENFFPADEATAKWFTCRRGPSCTGDAASMASEKRIVTATERRMYTAPHHAPCERPSSDRRRLRHRAVPPCLQALEDRVQDGGHVGQACLHRCGITLYAGLLERGRRLLQ